MVSWVIFDIGETLVKEQRLFDEWADWMEIPREKFWAELEQVIAERRDHREVFERLSPGFDFAAARALRAVEGPLEVLLPSDLYVDARSTVKMLAAKRYRVGVAGNQPAKTAEFISDLGWPVDLIGMSGDWEFAKPAPEFFQRLIELCDVPATQIIYVGDRIDNDVLPALAAGMHGVFLKRGPWGRAHAEWPEASNLRYVINNLSELLGLDLLQ